MLARVALPEVSVPLVPGTFNMVVDAFVAEEMGIQVRIAFFLAGEAVQHEGEFGFGQRPKCVHAWCGGAAPGGKRDNLVRGRPLVIGACSDTIGIDLVTAGDGTCDGALAVRLPGSGRAVPFLLAMRLLVEARAPEQAI